MSRSLTTFACHIGFLLILAFPEATRALNLRIIHTVPEEVVIGQLTWVGVSETPDDGQVLITDGVSACEVDSVQSGCAIKFDQIGTKLLRAIVTTGANAGTESPAARVRVSAVGWPQRLTVHAETGRPNVAARDIQPEVAFLSNADWIESSANGRFTAVAARDPAMGYPEDDQSVYLFDRIRRSWSRFPLDRFVTGAPSAGIEPRISADGRFVLTDRYFHDLQARYKVLWDTHSGELHFPETNELGEFFEGFASNSAVSSDGRYVIVAGIYRNAISPNIPLGPSVLFIDRLTGLLTVESIAPGTNNSPAPGYEPAISDDARFLTYVAGFKVFLRDRFERTTVVAIHDDPALRNAKFSDVSNDGRLVAYEVQNVHAGNYYQVYIHNVLDAQVTEVGDGTCYANGCLSVRSQSPKFYDNDTKVAFLSDQAHVQSDKNEKKDVYSFDMATQTYELISKRPDGNAPDGYSIRFAVTDEDAVYFISDATDISPGHGGPGLNVFLNDQGVVHPVSADIVGAETPGDIVLMSTSDSGEHSGVRTLEMLTEDDMNGRYDAYVVGSDHSIALASKPVPAGTGGADTWPVVSGDGRYVAFESEENLLNLPVAPVGVQVYRHDLLTDVTNLVSRSWGDPDVAATGNSDSPYISGDGRYVAFSSTATDISSHFPHVNSACVVVDMISGETTIESTDRSGQAYASTCWTPGLSADGRFITMRSAGLQLKDRLTGNVAVLDVSFDDSPHQGRSYRPHSTADGSAAVFFSRASNLVENDTNGLYDVFLRDLNLQTTIKVTAAHGGGESDGDSYSPTISADGQYVAFSSSATNLVESDDNGLRDIFLWRRASGETRLIAPGFAEAVDAERVATIGRISRDGEYIVFNSTAELTPGDANGNSDVFRVPNPFMDHPPAAVDDWFDVEVSASVSDSLLRPASNTWDVDPNGDPLTVTRVNGEQALLGVVVPLDNGGSVQVEGDGTFLYFAPAMGAPNATESITYTISDGLHEATASAVFNLIGTPPIAVEDILPSSLEDHAVAVDVGDLLSNDSGLDVYVESVWPIAGGHPLLADGQVEFIPYDDFNGTASFGYRIRNSDGLSGESSVSWDILPVNDRPLVAARDYMMLNNTLEPVVLADWLVASVPGPRNEGAQTIANFSLDGVEDPNGILLNATVTPDGSIEFEPTGGHGKALLFIVAADDGGVDNGGNDTSTPTSLAILSGPGVDIGVELELHPGPILLPGREFNIRVGAENSSAWDVSGSRINVTLNEYFEWEHYCRSNTFPFRCYETSTGYLFTGNIGGGGTRWKTIFFDIPASLPEGHHTVATVEVLPAFGTRDPNAANDFAEIGGFNGIFQDGFD